MGETKAAFAERGIQSLKRIFYRYIELHGENFVTKFQKFFPTVNSRKNRPLENLQRDVEINDFLSILFNKSLMKYTKPKLKIGDRVRISKKDIPFRKCYKPQLVDELFEIPSISQMKYLEYHQDLKKEEIVGKIYEKELRKGSDSR